jgi:hypothetical protein
VYDVIFSIKNNGVIINKDINYLIFGQNNLSLSNNHEILNYIDRQI